MNSTLCPDNSIHCLLRELLNNNSTAVLLEQVLKAQQGFNWDPLNFAFTAAIGVLALIVACVTVFQSLLAAGPGRRKASRTSIGAFAAQTKSRFDRLELSLRTTAQVPFLSYNTLCSISRSDHYEEVTRPRLECTASWVNLLERLSLARPVFWETVTSATDYLPADVQAAPASGDVMCLAYLAALADEHCIMEPDKSGRFILVRGKQSQLSFRDHPLLGPVALYELYSTPVESQRRKEVEYARLGIPAVKAVDIRGALDIAEGKFLCQDQYLHLSDPESGQELLDRLKDICGREYANISLCEESHNLLVLMVCDRPDQARIFPMAQWNLTSDIRWLGQHVTEWQQGSRHMQGFLEGVTQKVNEFVQRNIREKIQAPASILRGKTWVQCQTGRKKSTLHNRFLFDFMFSFNLHCLSVCLSWVEELKGGKETPIRNMHAIESFTKSIMISELQRVDRFIGVNFQQECTCIALTLVGLISKASKSDFAGGSSPCSQMTSAPMESVSADSRDGIAKYRLSQAQSLSSGGSTQGKLELTTQELRVLIAYRAILFAAVLGLCADSTWLDWECPSRHLVVKIL